MEINFNALRVNLAIEYDTLVKELNRHIQNDRETLGAGKDYNDTFVTGDIKDQMDNIRNAIITLCCIYDKETGIESISQDLNLAVFAEEK